MSPSHQLADYVKLIADRTQEESILRSIQNKQITKPHKARRIYLQSVLVQLALPSTGSSLHSGELHWPKLGNEILKESYV